MSIILLGTSHGDTKGKERLHQSLDILLPEILTIEASPEVVEIRKKDRQLYDWLRQTLTEKQINQNFIDFFMSTLPKEGETQFEIAAAEDYASRTGIKLKYIDDPSMAEATKQEGLRHYRDLISRVPQGAVINVPTPEELQTANDRNYAFAAFGMTTPNSPEVLKFLKTIRGSMIGKRDKYMEGEIRKEEDSEKRLVHIGGFAHMLDDPMSETLYSRIKNLRPERRLIYNPQEVF